MKIIKNTTGSPISINDVGGISIAAGGTYTIPNQDNGLWGDSLDVLPYLTAGTLVVNDGYDDLPPVLGAKHLAEESLVRTTSFDVAAHVADTANSTLSLTATSRLLMIFNGTVAGQIVKMPDATTLIAGCRYEIWNNSSQQVSVQDWAAGVLCVLPAAHKTWVLLRNASTQAGNWLTEVDIMGAAPGGIGIINMGYQGTASSVRWLEVISNNPTSHIPFIVAGSRSIHALSLSCQYAETGTVTVYKNGSAIETIAVTSQAKATKLNLNLTLADGDTLSAAVTSGTLSRPNLAIWL